VQGHCSEALVVAGNPSSHGEQTCHDGLSDYTEQSQVAYEQAKVG
jgi:hypothetical protein